MRVLRGLAWLGFGWIVILGLALGIWWLLPARTAPIAGEHAIAALERVRLGGFEQTILLRGHDTRNPLLLHLHGGPGVGQLPLAPYYADELERHFVVHWDQRGAGASCAGVDPATLTLDRVVADAIELAEQLERRFQRPLVLLGHSWGSLVGVLAVKQRPDLFAAYVGVGQIVHLRRNEELSYRWVVEEAKRRGDAGALAELEAIGPPPYASYDELGVQRSHLMRWGGSIHDHRAARAALPAFLFGREYDLATRVRFMGCFKQSMERIWERVQDVDLEREAARLERPVFLLIGRADYNTPFELAEAWASELEAPHLEVIRFEGVGHFLPIEQPQAFQAALVERVLPTLVVGS
jgi:pimeloyl-ACP methyl ester carboxylesterase